MTKSEKIDYIRKLDPSYRENSMLFGYSNKELDKIIEKLDLRESEKELKKEVVRLKNKCNKLVVAANDASESDINKLLLLKKENKALKQEIKKLKTMASILKKFIADDQVFINLIGSCFLIDGFINLSNDELELIEEELNEI